MAPAPRTHFSRAWPSEGAQPLLALPYMLRTCQARVAIAARAPIPAAMSARELRPRVDSRRAALRGLFREARHRHRALPPLLKRQRRERGWAPCWERARAEPAGATLPTNRLRTDKHRLQYLPQRHSNSGRAPAVTVPAIGKLRLEDDREFQAYLSCGARLSAVQIWGVVCISVTTQDLH